MKTIACVDGMAAALQFSDVSASSRVLSHSIQSFNPHHRQLTSDISIIKFRLQKLLVQNPHDIVNNYIYIYTNEFYTVNHL